jgi:molybdopterin molybdotransferase
MLTVEHARARMLSVARRLEGRESVPTRHAAGRVLAEPVIARVDVPPVDNSQMDGYAVRCADIRAAPARLPVSARIAAGQAPGVLAPGTAARIFTGAPIPQGCDAVVEQEATRAEGDHVVLLESPTPGKWIRRQGCDIALGATALALGQALRAQHLGVAASVGVAELVVVRKPKVALFCTGNELAMPGETPEPGRIFNSNRFVLAALLETLGCTVVDLGIVPDRLDATRQTLQTAAREADLIVSSGGVSVGEEDHVKAALVSLGELDLWQIAMKPGKPLAFGHAQGVPFIGLPGNPVSSFVTFVLFVRPFVLRCLGVTAVEPHRYALPAGFDRQGDGSRREFLRVRLNADGAVEPYPSQNAALLSSVTWADGLVELAPDARIERGQMVGFLSLGELSGAP